MKNDKRISEMIDLAAKNLADSDIIACLELEVKWAKVIFNSAFFKKMVQIRKNANSTEKN